MPASRTQYEGRALQRQRVTNLRRELPANGPPAVPAGTSSVDDTPLYWQTVQAMAIAKWRRDG